MFASMTSTLAVGPIGINLVSALSLLSARLYKIFCFESNNS